MASADAGADRPLRDIQAVYENISEPDTPTASAEIYGSQASRTRIGATCLLLRLKLQVQKRHFDLLLHKRSHQLQGCVLFLLRKVTPVVMPDACTT